MASGDRSIALGNQSTTNKGSYNIAQGNDSIGIGTSTSVFGYSGVSIGRRNIIGVPDPDLVKNGVLTTKSKTKYGEDDLGGNSVIVGAYNVAYGNRSNVIGTYSRAMGSNSVAIGSGVQSLSDGSIAIGKGSGYEFEDGSRFKNGEDVTGDYYGRDWELPPEYKVLKQVLSNDINGDKPYEKTSSERKGKYKYEKGGSLPKYNNYGAGSSDPGGFIVEGKNALGVGSYTQVRGDSAIGLATGEMTADLSLKDKSEYAKAMSQIMGMEEALYEAKEELEKLKAKASDTATLESAVKAAEESLATAKKAFRETYLKKYSFVDGNGAIGVGRQILAQGDRSMAVGDYAKAISNDAIAYGGQTLANGTNSMAMGGSAHVGTEKDAFANSMAIGSHTNVQAGNAVALGAFSQVTGTNSLALGFGTQSSTDSNSITYNSVSGHDSTLIGSYGNIAGNNSILIGSSGSIANDRVVGLGNNINIKAADQNDQENNTAGSVFLGDHAGYVKDSKRARSLGEVTLVGSEEKKELTESLSSTKGALRDYTKDFIYIYMLENQDDGTQIGAPIAVRSDFAGGDSTVGVVSVGSTYEQTFENLDKIKEHHKKVGSLITVPVEVTVQVTKNGISLGEQQQIRYFAADATQEQINSDSTLSDEDKKKVWDTIQESRKKADTKYTVFETRRIQNVAPGLIGSNSTDAINGSQLFATNQMLGNLVGSLKKALGDNVTITPDGQIDTKDEDNTPFTLGWIAKAGSVEGSNGTVAYKVDKAEDETDEAYQARNAKLEEDGYIVDAAKVMTFKAGKNIGLVQKPGELSISTIDNPSFKSVELRGETKEVNGSQETPVTMVDSSGMQVYTETVTPGDAGPTTTKKVSTTVNNKGVTTDGTVKVTNGKNGDQAKEFVTIDKGTDGSGTDKEYGKIGLDGKNGSNATITVDRGTSSLDDTKNIGGTDPKQDISENNPAKMDRITYTTKNKEGNDVTHEVATLDDGFMLTTSTDIANSKAPANVKLNNTIKFTDGANTKVSTVTSKDGVHELHVDVTGLPMTYTVSQTGGTDAPVSVSKVGDTYQLANGTKLVKVDDKFYKPDQLDTNGQPKADQADKDWKVTNSISLVNPNGEKNAPTLKHVGSGLVDDAGNVTSLADAPDTNAVNVGDLKQVAAAAKTEVTGSGAAEVTKVTGADGQNIYNVHVDKLMTVKPVDSKANITRGGDGKYYKLEEIQNKTYVPNADGNGGNWYNADDVVNGVPKPDAQPQTVKPADIKNSIVNPNSNDSIVLDNIKSGIGGEAGNGIQNGTTIDGTTGNNTFIKNLDKVGKPANEGGIDKTTVVNAGDLKNLADTPLFFSGDAADGVVAADGTDKNTFSRKLSQETKIVGGVDLGLKENATADERKKAIAEKLSDNNIGVVSNGTDTLTIKLAKNLVNLTSVETGSGDNKTKMTKNGITTTVKDGDTFKVTTTTPNGLTTTEEKLDINNKPTGKSTTTMVTTDGVTITTQTPKNGDKPASTTETKLSKDGLATDGTIKVIGDNAKDLVTIGKGTETDPNATDKEFGTVAIDGKNGSKATLTVDRGTKSVTDSANVGKDPTKPIDKDNPAAGMDRLTYTTTTGIGDKTIEIEHQVATLDDGFFLTTEHTEADKTRTVLFNNTIKVLDGANTKVSAMGGEDGTHTFSIDVTGLPVSYTVQQDGNTTPENVSKVGDTYQLANGTKLVKVGNKFYKPDQLVNPTVENPTVKQGEENKDWKLTNNVSLVNPNGGKDAPTLSNVGSALKKSDGTRITMSDLDDSSTYPTDNPIWNNAVNVGDLKAATDAARTEVTGTGKAIVTKKTGDKGQNIYNVHVDPIVDVVGADGSKVVRGDDGKYYNPTDIANKTFVPDGKGGGSWYNNSDLTDGKPKPDAKPQTIETANIKNKMVNPNSNDSIVLDNVKSGIGGKVVDPEHENKNTFMENVDTIGKANGISENTVVNAGDLKNLVDTGFKLNTSGHSGEAKTVKIGETIKVVDGANTKVSAIDDSTTGTYTFHIDVTGLPVTYTATETDGEGKPTGTPVDVTKTKDGYQKADGTPLIKINENGKDVYYTADQLDNNVPKPGAKGLTITDNIRLINPKDGTGATKITNVAAGTDDTDAVNVSQLKQKVAAATTEVTGTGAAEVTKVTGADGQNVYNVHVDKLMTVKPVDPKANITRGGDGKYYNKDDIAGKTFVSDGNGGGSWYNASDVDAKTGKPLEGKSALAKQPIALDQSKLKNSVVNPNGDGATIVDNVKSGIGGEVKDTSGKNTFIDNINKVGKKNPDGTVAPDAISENTVVNAGDLKNLVDTGFKLNTSGHSGDAQTVKIGETIKVVDGANTKVSDITSKDGVHEFHIDVTGLPMTYTVSQTGDAGTSESVSKVGDTYQLADGTKLVKVGDKFYKPSQLVDPNAEQLEVKPEEVAKNWTVNDSISLVNKEGSNNAPTLKNVGSGLKDAAGNATSIDQAVGTNAVNVDDLRTLGKAATTEVTGTGAAEVTKVTGANGQNIYNVHVERFMQVAETDVEGNKVVKAADNYYYKEADIKDKTYIDGQWYNNTDIKDKTKIGDKWYNADDVVNGVPKPNATESTVQATAPNKAVGLQNNLVNPNDNTPTRLSNLASALSGEVGNGANPADNSAINGIDKNGKPTSESGSNTFVKNVLDLDATEKTVEQLKTSLGHDPSEDEVKAEKARAEKDKALLNSAVTVADLQKTLQSPLFFEGDSADGVANENGSDKNTFARKLSQKTKIVGGVDLGLKENATADERKKAIAEKLTDHNIGVISNGTDTLTIKLAKDLTDLHSVTTTDDKGNTTQINGKGLATTADNGKGNIKITTVTSDGITIVTTDKDGNNSVSLTNKGLDNGHHQIINVKSGLRDRQGNPVTLKNASGDILNNAVNVKDLRDVVQGLTDSGKGGGFGLTGNNGEVHKSLGETITLKGGIANKLENGIDMNKPEKATTDKNTYIDVKTSENGSEKIMVVEIAKDLTDLNSAEFTDQEGNTTKMKGDGIYIDKNGDGNADISLTSEGLNNGGNKITNVADGTEDTDAVNVSQLNKLKQEIKQNIGDEINELNAYAPVVYSDKDGNRVIRKGNKFVKKNDETVEILPQDIRLSLVNADGKTTNPSTLQNVAKGVQDTDAVNVKQLKEATKKPLTFNGDDGSSSAKLGETVAIKGGANSADLTDNNIGVIANSSTKTLNVKLSKKLKGLESAEFVDNNGNTTNITGDGVHISGGNGSNVSLTSQGLNNGGNRITNVAPGVEATDAVNVSQLNQVGAALHNRINNVAKGAYGGVASAGAMASLPQAYLPGKSMVAAGASHYRGESAVALGASRISDNGKIILKLNASHNTSGNTMVGAGVGYQF
nr:YadA-like family protein [Gallibacterium anatis]